MQIFYAPETTNGIFKLNSEESKHCTKVLRKKIGDKISVIDGKGNFYHTTIIDDSFCECALAIDSVTEEYEKLNYNLHIAIAPTKNTERIEWFVEKATEIGISQISFLTCDHSERVHLKLDRLEKVAVSAMKQSLKAYKPRLNELCSFEKFISTKFDTDQLFIAHCENGFDKQELNKLLEESSGKEIVVLIGPEGDFSKREIELAFKQGFKSVSLGKSRLRTETAALYATAIVSLFSK